MATRSAHPVAPASTSALDALLEAEQEISRRQADADRESNALLDAARADAAATAQEATATLERELTAIAERSRRDVDEAVRSIQRDAERAVARYRALGPADIAVLAADVVAQSTGLGAVT